MPPRIELLHAADGGGILILVSRPGARCRVCSTLHLLLLNRLGRTACIACTSAGDIATRGADP